jgi:probable HAF family extracellular repeat protein
MKSRIFTLLTAMTLFAALAVSVRLAAQEQQQVLPRYTVTDLGTLGGTYSLAGGINNKGVVEGYSTLTGDQNVHAALWRKGKSMITDLGTLGGPNSDAAWRPSQSDEVGGGSDTTTPDPNGEDYCGYGTYLQCLPFIWRAGVMTPLPTFGGNNGYAAGFNKGGQMVGQAELNKVDPTCVLPAGFLQVGAALWENGTIKKLHRFPGDTDAYAFAINDLGQATGGSGSCTSSFHAVLWHKGSVVNLGNLGGAMNNSGLDINNQGQVAGYSDLAGDTTYHAFLWQKGTGMIDLGTLPGDVASSGDGINNKGQVVGGSCDQDGNCRAYLWQNGVMTDLNTLIPANSPLYLIEATGTINDRGQIAGIALKISTGETHAFVANPTTASGPISEREKVVLPENVRKLLQQRRGGHFGVGMKRPQ